MPFPDYGEIIRRERAMMEKVNDYVDKHPSNAIWIWIRGHRHVLESDSDSFNVEEILKFDYHKFGRMEHEVESLLAQYFIDRAKAVIPTRYSGWTEDLTFKWNKSLVYS
jgi:hypothetical protein